MNNYDTEVKNKNKINHPFNACLLFTKKQATDANWTFYTPDPSRGFSDISADVFCYVLSIVSQTYNIINKRTADIMVYYCILLNNAMPMVKCTEKEGSGLLGGEMPSALTAGKRVPLS